MKIDPSKTLNLKGEKSASAPKIGEPVTRPAKVDAAGVEIADYKLEDRS